MRLLEFVCLVGRRYSIRFTLICSTGSGQNAHSRKRSAREHRAAIEQVRSQIWELYQDLKAYRAQPREACRPALEARFDTLVGQRTGYPSINGVLKEMREHKVDLLAGAGAA